MTTQTPPKQSHRAVRACVYGLVAYAVVATVAWARSNGDASADCPPPTAAKTDCVCDARAAAPLRPFASSASAAPTACDRALEPLAGAAAEPAAGAAASKAEAADIGRGLIAEVYGDEAAESADPAELIGLLEDLQSDRARLPDDRLEAAFVLRRLHSSPPAVDVATEFLELAAAAPDGQLALDVLELTSGALEPRHAEALIDLAQRDDPAVRSATMLRLYELLRGPASGSAVLPAVEGHSESLDALARYVRSAG